MTDEQISGVKRASIDNEEMRQQLQKSAVLLANYFAEVCTCMGKGKVQGSKITSKVKSENPPK